MDCLDDAVLASFVEGRAVASTVLAIEEHVDRCAACRELLAEIAREVVLEPTASRGEEPASEEGPASLRQGTQVGRYVVLEQIGRGAMGIVYAAYDPELARRLALKVLRPELSAQLGSEGARARVLREAQAMARLPHPNIVGVYDCGTVDGRVFVAMELSEGDTLGAWLRERPRPFREVLDRFMQAGRGLSAVHGAGVVHRDFKADNVLCARDGRVRLTDFGLARIGYAAPPAGVPVSREALAQETRTGTLMGTPAYMSPEQLAGRTPDARSDQFGFCVALYEALYGERPFAGRTIGELAKAIEQGRVREPPKQARVPGFVRRCLLRGLAARPDDRFPSMDALLSALGQAPSIRRRRAAAAVTVTALAAAASWLGFARRPQPEDFSAGTGNAEARAAFRAGMTAWHDGNGDTAVREWERAAKLDTSYGAPELWRAAELGTAKVLDARGPFKRATLTRGSLSGPNAGLYAALAPYLTRDIPDGAALITALERLAKQAPSAGEITQMLGWYRINITGPTPAVLADFDETLARDPSMLGAVAGRGWVLPYLGRFDEALAVLDRCSRMSPAPADCIMSLAGVQLRRGECAALQATAERWRAVEPESSLAHYYLARARQGLGAPVEEVHELLQQATARPAQAQVARWGEAMLDGRFEDAGHAAQEYESQVASRNSRFTRVAARAVRIMTAQETGDRDEAAQLAEDTLRRVRSWQADPAVDDQAIGRDLEPFLLSVLVELGRMPRRERAERRAVWLAAWRARTPAAYLPFLWVRGYVSDIAGDEDAREALAAMPASGVPPFLPGKYWADAGLGKMFLASGSPERALPYLRIAAQGCDGLDTPRTTVRASLWLGQALQATGDKGGACRAWQTILDRWGKAKPRSVTAEEAQALAKAAGCPEHAR